MSLIIFIFSIMILVIVHEAGHYLMARFFRVAIAEFSIGFGRALWSYQHPRYLTRFKFAPILLGGYVKFYESEAPPESGRLYQTIGLGQKILILLAGPIANLLFAFWLLMLLFKLTTYTLIPIVGDLFPSGLAAQAGLKTGQKIIGVNHHAVNSWEGVLQALQTNQPLTFTVLEGEKKREIQFTQLNLGGEKIFQILGFKPFVPKLPAVIGKIQEKSPAALAGLNVGDKILTMNRHPVESFVDVLDYLKAHPGQNILLQYQRLAQKLSTTIVVKSPEEKLGIYSFPLSHYPQWFVLVQNSWSQAFVSAARYCWKLSVMQLRLWFNLPQEIHHLSSPWGISKSMNEAWSIGVKTFLQLMVWLSISLAIVNLLPIPILDGGQCWVVILEYLFPGFLTLHRQRFLLLWSLCFLFGLFAVGLLNDFAASS